MKINMGRRLKELRIKKGMTQLGLAKRWMLMLVLFRHGKTTEQNLKCTKYKNYVLFWTVMNTN